MPRPHDTTRIIQELHRVARGRRFSRTRAPVPRRPGRCPTCRYYTLLPCDVCAAQEIPHES